MSSTTTLWTFALPIGSVPEFSFFQGNVSFECKAQKLKSVFVCAASTCAVGALL
jgi:hypothetical protein